ncbi:hypothetical protein M9H77_19061 [Catharanthus roseus]|uniref:Uncharacterized protein n=1 Tax=Catharanthus roseus TaxID=4058 RepID=A0ACC0B9B7_CATRO|nr:hypothetical protein M9H77_19061 [Catharanthus roseus]
MCLQQRTQNIVTAVRMIQTIKEDLKKYRNDDDYWEELLGVVTAFCIKYNIFLDYTGVWMGSQRLTTIFFVETSFLRSYWISSSDRAHLIYYLKILIKILSFDRCIYPVSDG